VVNDQPRPCVWVVFTSATMCRTYNTPLNTTSHRAFSSNTWTLLHLGQRWNEFFQIQGNRRPLSESRREPTAAPIPLRRNRSVLQEEHESTVDSYNDYDQFLFTDDMDVDDDQMTGEEMLRYIDQQRHSNTWFESR